MPSASQVAGAYILLFISNTLSASAGVGGGLLNVAILHSVLGESFKDSIVLSLATILGSTTVQLLINLQARHPADAKKSVIYWDMVAIMLPAELGGSNLGVILSDIVPSTILYISAILVLMVGGIYSAKKAVHLYEAENERSSKKVISVEESFVTANPMTNVTSGKTSEQAKIKDLLSPFEMGGDEEAGNGDASTTSKAVDESFLPPLELPWTIMSVIAVVVVLYVILYVVMSIMPGCSLGWGLTLVFVYLIVIVQVPWTFNYLMLKQNKAPDAITPGDVSWNSSTFSIPAVTFTIGLLTALLGFGGGELIGPYLLHLHIKPIVSTSTSGMIGFLNNALSLIHFGILGKVNYNQSAGVCVVGMVAGLCGRLFSLWFVAKYDRASILVCALSVVLFFSWIVYIVYISTDKASFEVQKLC